MLGRRSWLDTPSRSAESAVKKPTVPDLRTELAARIIAHAHSAGQNNSAMRLSPVPRDRS